MRCALADLGWTNIPHMAETPARPSRAAEKAAATRQALVDVAVELFSEQGYMQTSIRDIARRGAVTSGAIYGHFRNKADLLVEAINQRTAEELESQTMGVSSAAIAARVLRLTDASVSPNSRRRSECPMIT